MCYNSSMENSTSKLSRGAISLTLFALSVIFLILLTLFESSLADLSLNVEKILSGLLLILPGILGILFGISSLVRKEDKLWIAVIGIVLNALFALFHISVLAFAG